MAVPPLLLDSQIEASRVLVDVLEGANFGVRAAYWIYNSDLERWRFNVATADMSDGYSTKVLQAAEIAHDWQARHPSGAILDLAEVSWVDANDRLVVGLSKIAKMGDRKELRLSNRFVDGVYLEDVLVQRMAA